MSILQSISTKSKVIVALSILIGIALFTFYVKYTDKKEQEALSTMTVAEKKERFRTLIIPAVNQVYDELNQRYIRIEAKIQSEPSSAEVEKLKTEYKADTNQALLAALKPHPRSIAVAQAAMESSWATSRFFRKAKNVFGVWSFDENEPRIAAGEQRGDKTIWVKKYRSVYDSVWDYYRTIARGDAYKEFRALNLTSQDPHLLVTKLDRYSEKGAAYGEELSAIIKFNRFEKIDADDTNK